MTDILVESQAGATDSDKLAAACTAALKVAPSTVVLPDRELRLTRYQNVRLGVSVNGYGNSRSKIFLDYPGASAPVGNSPYGLNVSVYGTPPGETLFSNFGIRARSTGYYRLITGLNAAGIELDGLDFGVCGQSFAEFRGCSAVLIDSCLGKYGGDNSFDGASSKYKIGFVGCDGVTVEGCTLGDPTHDRNQSYVTINNSHDVVVRNNVLYGSRTYCVNTHGTGSSDVSIEDNVLYPGMNARFGGILLGNEAWGPDTGIRVRDNRLYGLALRFLQARENTDYVTVVGNEAHDLTDEFLLAYGTQIAQGSLHWIVRRNRSNRPAVFGRVFTSHGYAGVSDVEYSENDMPAPIFEGQVERVTPEWAWGAAA